MSAVIINIADTLAERLNSESFSIEFDAVRMYRPVFDLPEMKDLRVTVVPRSVEVVRLGRSPWQHDYTIDIAVQQAIGSDSDIDALMQLAEELQDHFTGLSLAVNNELYPVLSVVIDPLFAPEHLSEMQLFTTVITVTFRTSR